MSLEKQEGTYFTIHNVSFCIFNIIVNSSLEYFSLLLNTIPRKTRKNDTISCINKD